MNIIKALLIVSTVASVCLAQINISGTVTDTGGTPLEGAAVWLEEYGYSDTTGSDGKFSLISVGINNHIQLTHKISVKVNNGSLLIATMKKSPVEIITYNLQGKCIHKVTEKEAMGERSITVNTTGMSSGGYICRLAAPGGIIACRKVVVVR